MKSLITIILFLSIQSQASVQKLVWGIDNELYYHNRVAKEFSEKIKKLTSGEVEVEIENYSEREIKSSTMDLIKSGRFQIAQGTTQEFTRTVPELDIWNFPFLFESFEHAEKYIKSDSSQKIIQKLNQLPYMQAVDYSFSGGPVYIFSKEKINSFSELANQELSLIGDSNFYEDFLRTDKIGKKLEGNIKLHGQGEVLAAGADTIFARDDANKIWINKTNHRVISRFVFISKEALEKMGPKNKNIVLDELKKLMIKERSYSREGAELGEKILLNRGAKLNEWNRTQKLAELKRWEDKVNLYKKNYLSELKYVDSINPKKPLIFSNEK